MSKTVALFPGQGSQHVGMAKEFLENFAIAREAFGNEVVEHYSHAAAVELAAFDATVTDWERHRGFERL